MDVIKFNLSGKFGFFKKPDVNTYLYFTYGNIHKVAILGMLGAILGYKGYSQMSFNENYSKQFGLKNDKKRDYPEFYEKLKHLNIAIKPNEVSFSKKVQIFNNSVGYASKEKGGNLVIKEQWLENPSWEIYIAIEDQEGEKIAKALLENKFIYIPYLGKNDHLADITNIELIKNIKEINSIKVIDSLFMKDDFEFTNIDSSEDEFEFLEERLIFKYEEKLPLFLEELTNKYELRSFIYTNSQLYKIGNLPVYNIKGKNIVFM
jgi:CRISPR-associated protein Cas5h